MSSDFILISCLCDLSLLHFVRFSSYFAANFPGWQPRARGQSVIGVIGQAKAEYGQTNQIYSNLVFRTCIAQSILNYVALCRIM